MIADEEIYEEHDKAQVQQPKEKMVFKRQAGFQGEINAMRQKEEKEEVIEWQI